MSLWDSIKARLKFPRAGGQNYPTGRRYGWLSCYADDYDYTETAGDIRLNATVQAGIAWMQRTVIEAPLQVTKRDRTGEENAVPDHPLTAFLRQPNPFTSGTLFWSRVLADWVATGNAYALKVRSGTGNVVQLWNVPQNRIRPQWSDSGREYIGHYLLLTDAEPQQWRPEDVVHFRFGTDPANERMGWSPLLAGVREVAALNAGAGYKGALLSNMGVPAHAISPKNEAVPFTSEQRDALETRWTDKLRGRGVGRVIVSTIPLTIERPGFSPEELGLGELLYWDVDSLCALMGLSAQVLNLTSGHEAKTYANYSEAREAAYEACVIPTHTYLDADLQRQLLPDFGDPEEETVGRDYTQVRILQEDETRLWKRLDDAVKTGWLLRNEARALIGKPPIDGWDEEDMKPKPEPPPFVPESTGDAQVNAEEPAPRAGQPEESLNGNGR